MIDAIFRFLSSGLSVLNKLLPSWEWKGGEAAADARHAKETADGKARMDAVPAPDEQSTRDRLRKGKF